MRKQNALGRAGSSHVGGELLLDPRQHFAIFEEHVTRPKKQRGIIVSDSLKQSVPRTQIHASGIARNS